MPWNVPRTAHCYSCRTFTSNCHGAKFSFRKKNQQKKKKISANATTYYWRSPDLCSILSIAGRCVRRLLENSDERVFDFYHNQMLLHLSKQVTLPYCCFWFCCCYYCRCFLFFCCLLLVQRLAIALLSAFFQVCCNTPLPLTMSPHDWVLLLLSATSHASAAKHTHVFFPVALLTSMIEDRKNKCNILITSITCCSNNINSSNGISNASKIAATTSGWGMSSLER